MYNLVVLSMFTIYVVQSSWKMFYFQNTSIIPKINPYPQLPLPWATTNLLSVSTDSSILDISYICNRTMCSLLCLVSFYQHVFKGHPCHSMYQYFIPLLWPNNNSLHRYTTYPFIHSSTDEHLGFHFLAVMNNFAMNTCVKVFV